MQMCRLIESLLYTYVNFKLMKDTGSIWASTREHLSSGVCKQHRRRPACTYAQSDQRLCYSRFVKYHDILTTDEISIF